jgi:hypothetical protein
LLNLNCSTKHKPKECINKKELNIILSENEYIIELDKNNSVKIYNDLTSTKLILNDNKAIDLDFTIIPPYLTNAYYSNIKNTGNVLILESYPIGASGLSANITNVNIVFLDSNLYGNVVSYNSFYGGIDLLWYNNEKLMLDIYVYNGLDSSGNIIYCRNSFEFIKQQFLKSKIINRCYLHLDSGLYEYQDCDCFSLKTPYVLSQ